MLEDKRFEPGKKVDLLNETGVDMEALKDAIEILDKAYWTIYVSQRKGDLTARIILIHAELHLKRALEMQEMACAGEAERRWSEHD